MNPEAIGAVHVIRKEGSRSSSKAVVVYIYLFMKPNVTRYVVGCEISRSAL